MMPSPRKATARPKAKPRDTVSPRGTVKPTAKAAGRLKSRRPKAAASGAGTGDRPVQSSPRPSRTHARCQPTPATGVARVGNACRGRSTGSADTRGCPARTARLRARSATRPGSAGATRRTAMAAATVAPARRVMDQTPAAAAEPRAILVPRATCATRGHAAARKAPQSTRLPRICRTPRRAAQDRCAPLLASVPATAAFSGASRASHVRSATRFRAATPIRAPRGGAAWRMATAPVRRMMAPARRAVAGRARRGDAGPTAPRSAVPAEASAVPAPGNASAASGRTAAAATAASSSVMRDWSAVWPPTAMPRAGHPGPTAARPASRRRCRQPAPNGW